MFASRSSSRSADEREVDGYRETPQARRMTALSTAPPNDTFSCRRDQMFPVLGDGDLARAARFGTPRSYATGEYLFRAGQPGPGMFIVLSGLVTISQRDGLGHVVPIVREGAGAFLAEVGQLSGAPSLVDG